MPTGPTTSGRSRPAARGGGSVVGSPPPPSSRRSAARRPAGWTTCVSPRKNAPPSARAPLTSPNRSAAAAPRVPTTSSVAQRLPPPRRLRRRRPPTLDPTSPRGLRSPRPAATPPCRLAVVLLFLRVVVVPPRTATPRMRRPAPFLRAITAAAPTPPSTRRSGLAPPHPARHSPPHPVRHSPAHPARHSPPRTTRPRTTRPPMSGAVPTPAARTASHLAGRAAATAWPSRPSLFRRAATPPNPRPQALTRSSARPVAPVSRGRPLRLAFPGSRGLTYRRPVRAGRPPSAPESAAGLPGRALRRRRCRCLRSCRDPRGRAPLSCRAEPVPWRRPRSHPTRRPAAAPAPSTRAP